MAYSDSNFHSQNGKLFAEAVGISTGGDLTITVHAGGSLFSGADIQRAVQTGQAPIGERFIFCTGLCAQSRRSHSGVADAVRPRPTSPLSRDLGLFCCFGHRDVFCAICHQGQFPIGKIARYFTGPRRHADLDSTIGDVHRHCAVGGGTLGSSGADLIYRSPRRRRSRHCRGSGVERWTSLPLQSFSFLSCLAARHRRLGRIGTDGRGLRWYGTIHRSPGW